MTNSSVPGRSRGSDDRRDPATYGPVVRYTVLWKPAAEADLAYYGPTLQIGRTLDEVIGQAREEPLVLARPMGPCSSCRKWTISTLRWNCWRIAPTSWRP